MLTLRNLSYEIAGRFLYRDLNWQITPGERVALVGKNGSGKSTLLRLITRQLTPTEGAVEYGNDMRIGFLNQDLLSFESTDSIFEIARTAFNDLLALQEEIDQLLNQLESQQDEATLNRLAELQTNFEQRGGYEIDARVHAVLGGLGFPAADHQRPYSEFSGGWRMRIQLARLLLQAPEVLLLDEPTNHLDLPAIQWLENYIRDFPGAVILVSHDRDFINRAAQKVVEIRSQRLFSYTGNYDDFLTQREEQIALQRASYENQQKYIADTERFINRFRAKANKASQAQSRLKALEKLERVEEPEAEEANINLKFTSTVKPGHDILELENLEKTFPSKTILEGAEAFLHRGDKVGLIGANGTGKSTLLRILANTEAFGGKRRVGHNVRMTFYAQHQLEALNLDNTIWQEVLPYTYTYGDTHVRSVLGCFLFSGDAIDKPIKVLSGGEKARVALAKTLLEDANFLLLDEPTNHLDLQSIQILGNALRQFEGTYVIVSHDRHFLREVTNKVWYLEGERIIEYPGSFQEYENRPSTGAQAPEKPTQQPKKQAAEKTTNGANGSPTQAGHKQMKRPETQATPPTPTPESPKYRNQNREQQKRQRKLRKQVEDLESRIAQLEQQRQELGYEMADPDNATNFELLKELQTKDHELQKELKATMNQWEDLAIQLDS